MSESQIVNLTKENNPRHATQPFIIVGCLIKQNGKYLLVKQNEKWNHPCGWLEMEEKIIEGAKREAEEETGLEIKIIDLIGIYALIKHKRNKTLHAVKFIFRAEPTGRKLKHFDNLHCGWFTPDQIETMDFWDPDIPSIIKQAEQGTSYPLSLVNNIIVA